MTGIGAAYYLRANGIPYAILEAKSDLGGVWNTHRWHGARCDSDFIKYSFSFKPYLSAQCLQGREQIHDYLRGVAKEFCIVGEHPLQLPRAQGACSDPPQQRWAVHTNRGVFAAQFLINGNGYFADEPHVPAFRDADKFKGEIVHTSHLDGRRSFAGKKVVVVGSGATAICCAPELARGRESRRAAAALAVLHLRDQQPGRIPRSGFARLSTGWGCAARCNGCAATCSSGTTWSSSAFAGFRASRAGSSAATGCGAVGGEAFRRDFSPRYNPWEQRIAVAIGLKAGAAPRAAQHQDRRDRALHRVRHRAAERRIDRMRRLRPRHRPEPAGSSASTSTSATTKIALERINFYKGLMVGGIPNYFHPMGSWHSAWTQRLEPVDAARGRDHAAHEAARPRQRQRRAQRAGGRARASRRTT